MASVGVTSKLKDHQQQMTFLDQTKTLAESALQMLYAAKEGGGNPKVQQFYVMLSFLYVAAPPLERLSGSYLMCACVLGVTLHTGVPYP